MGLLKSTMLGTGAAFVAVAGAQAADLPTRKAAPVEYVRICDAYGAGFFFIPGTDTCIKIGGRLRADYAYVPGRTGIQAGGIGSSGTTSSSLNTTFSGAQHTLGWEARGRITLESRTRTAWGTVQTVAAFRMARVNGVLTATDGPSVRGHGTGSTLETAYVRFAGFTFGAARDNFAQMPSLTYGAGHWGSFANGAKQIAYTHSFGGGFSATLALQDHMDTLASSASGGISSGSSYSRDNPYFAHRSIPQVVGRLDLMQGWGSLSVAGAVANIVGRNQNDSFRASETVWAVTGGATFNLPMLARGSKLYLTAAYADGMTEYTTNWTSVKTTAYARDAGGYVMNHPSYVFEAGPDRIETVKSWNMAALLEHYWTPQWRSVGWASYGQVEAPTTAAGRAWNGINGFGDATVWNVGTNLAWLPTRNFEIGVEVIYARVSQDVNGGAKLDNTPTNEVMYRDKSSNVTGRLRVERNF